MFNSCKRYIVFLSISIILGFLVSSSFAQEPPKEEPVVRINTSLVQLDAVVTDERGNIVTDLTRDDFEIYENKKEQKINNFSFVPISNVRPKDKSSINKNNLPTPNLKLEDLRRTIALVADSLNISQENIARLKQSMRTFVDEKMQPGDLVAIIRTGQDVGSLQQFTSEKRLLYAAIDNLRPVLGIAAGNARISVGQDFGRAIKKKSFSLGTLGAINTMVNGLKDLPGRKSIVIFSDGFPSFDTSAASAEPNAVFESISRLADLANRASVVIYTVDTNGLQTSIDGSTPSNNTSTDSENTNSDSSSSDLSSRQSIVNLGPIPGLDSRPASQFLTEQTGGFRVKNSNDIDKAIDSVLKDLQGYYLLSYSPDEETFDNKNKNNKLLAIEVKVKRPGLKVRSRRGFLRENEESQLLKAPTISDKLFEALTFPFSSDDIKIRATACLSYSLKKTVLRALVYIDGHDITLSKEKNGSYQGAFNVHAMAYGDNGIPIETFVKTQKIDLTERAYEKVIKNGLVTDVYFPIKKAGDFQFRVAIHDIKSGKVASTNQYIQVPKDNKRFGLSSLLLGSNQVFLANEYPEKIRTFLAALNSSSLSEVEFCVDSITRVFSLGEELKYNYQIYNLKPDEKNTVLAELKLFSEGKEVLSLSEKLPEKQKDANFINVSNSIKLSSDLKPGSYYLQITVSDRLDKNKNISQGIDFELVK